MSGKFSIAFVIIVAAVTVVIVVVEVSGDFICGSGILLTA
jgi:hypothetical protein